MCVQIATDNTSKGIQYNVKWRRGLDAKPCKVKHPLCDFASSPCSSHSNAFDTIQARALRHVRFALRLHFAGDTWIKPKWISAIFASRDQLNPCQWWPDSDHPMVTRRKENNAARVGSSVSQRPDRPRSSSQADRRCFQAAQLQGQCC